MGARIEQDGSGGRSASDFDARPTLAAEMLGRRLAAHDGLAGADRLGISSATWEGSRAPSARERGIIVAKPRS